MLMIDERSLYINPGPNAGEICCEFKLVWPETLMNLNLPKFFSRVVEFSPVWPTLDDSR